MNIGFTDDKPAVDLIKSLGSEVYSLQETLPKNKEGLPTSYIDAQAILEKKINSYDNIDTSMLITQATVQLDYQEGYPTVNGLPFWEKLDGELLDYYKLFQCYRDLVLNEGTRSFQRVSEVSNIRLSFINGLSKAYLWRHRAKAYDLYKKRKKELQREREIEDMEGKHTKAAKRLFTLAMNKIEEIIEDDKDKVGVSYSVKEIKEVMELAVKLERLSRNLPTDKPIEDQETVNALIQQNFTQVNDNSKTQNITAEAKNLQEVLDILTKANVIDPKAIETEVVEVKDNDKQ